MEDAVPNYFGAGGGGGGRNMYGRAEAIHHLPPLLRIKRTTCGLIVAVVPSGFATPVISASESTHASVGSRNRTDMLVTL